MKLRQYLNETKISEDQLEKKLKKINNTYYRVYKTIINKMIKSREGQYYYYNSWEDIQETAAENVNIKHINDQFTTKFLSDYESSLEALLSAAQGEIG